MQSFDSALSSEVISEVIVDYVESIFPSILNELVIPSKEQFELRIRTREIRSRRRKEKYRSDILKQIESKKEFFWHVNNLKRKYKKTNVEHGTIPYKITSFSDQTSSMDEEEIVNSNEAIRSNGRPLDNTDMLIPPENVQITHFFEIIKGKLSDNLDYQGEPVPFVQENEILDKIELCINNDQYLSFSNLIEIREVVTFSDKRQVKDRLFKLIKTYLKTVKRRDAIDAVKEFDYHELTLSEISKEIPLETQAKLDESLFKLLKATILYEFRRQYRNTGLNYINGKIAFEEYSRKIEEYTWNASRLFSQ